MYVDQINTKSMKHLHNIQIFNFPHLVILNF